MMKSKCPW